ncbi:MAG: hypothetical protein PVH29_05300 [Candidatus Zixiibacteriota bacterium]|jgi:hypothetical protein
MKKLTLCLALIAVLAFAFGCGKKKTEEAGTSEAPSGGDIAKFDEGVANFREAIRFVSLTPDKAKAAEAAKAAETAMGEVKAGWPTDPPEEFEGDNDWANRITSLTKIMGDVGTQAEAEKFIEAESSILEAQKLLLELHEKNNINTAGDEAVRLLVIADEMDLAFSEKRFNDMKHIMPNMREAQKNFFGSTMPASASGREDQFDDLKDKVYDGVEEFAEASDRDARGAALQKLIKTTTEFYVEFG